MLVLGPGPQVIDRLPRCPCGGIVASPLRLFGNKCQSRIIPWLKSSPMPDATSSPSLAFPLSSHRIKRAVWIALGVIFTLIATLVVAPYFIDLGLFKSTYLPRLEEALNRRLDVGEVRLSLIPAPSIRLSNLKVFDGPANPNNAFFAAKQVQLRLRLWPLVHGRFEVSELVLDRPVFNLLKEPDGTFNYSDLVRKKSAAAGRRELRRRTEGPRAVKTGAAPLLIPGNLRVHDGALNILSKGQTPVHINGIELSLRDFSGNAPFPFRASFNYPGLKTVSWEGEINYQEDKAFVDLKNNRVKIQDVTLPVQGSISNLSGTPRINLSSNTEKVNAKTVFEILSVFSLAPRDTEISGPMGLSMNVAGPSTGFMTQVRGRFNDVKVYGKRALKGSLSGEVLIKLPLGSGPVSQRLLGNGKLTARDGELTNVDLIKKIERVTGMIGLSKDERHQATTFKTLEGDFVIGGGRAEFTRLYLVNPQMEVTGNGSMTIEHPTFNLAISTALAPQASARAGRGRMTNFFKDKQGRIVVPLQVTGPVESPSVNVNAAKLAESGLPQNVEQGFSSFFKRLFRSP
jgi:AsmA protein